VTVTPTDLTSAVLECYVKESKDIADDADSVLVLTSASATEIEVIDPEAGTCRVFFDDVNMTQFKWYHLDVIKSGRRLTHAYGKIKVINV
jgi:hypothetical protein